METLGLKMFHRTSQDGTKGTSEAGILQTIRKDQWDYLKTNVAPVRVYCENMFWSVYWMGSIGFARTAEVG